MSESTKVTEEQLGMASLLRLSKMPTHMMFTEARRMTRDDHGDEKLILNDLDQIMDPERRLQYITSVIQAARVEGMAKGSNYGYHKALDDVKDKVEAGALGGSKELKAG